MKWKVSHVYDNKYDKEMRDDFPLEQEFFSRFGEHARGWFERNATKPHGIQIREKTYFVTKSKHENVTNNYND